MTCLCGKAVHYKTTGECKSCYMKRYRQEKPEKVTEHNSKRVHLSYSEWPEKRKQTQRDGISRRRKIYGRGDCASRRALKKNATVLPLPTNYYTMVMDFYKVCGKCGASDNLHLDHVIPLSRGGAHAFYNFGVLCAPCNLLKGASLEEDYRPVVRLVGSGEAR